MLLDANIIVPMDFVILSISLIGVLIATIASVFWYTMKKSTDDAKDGVSQVSAMLNHTNDVINKNTEAYNNLALIVNSIQTKDIGDGALCIEKHGVINKRLSNMDCELKDVKKDVVNHSERLYKLEQRV